MKNANGSFNYKKIVQKFATAFNALSYLPSLSSISENKSLKVMIIFRGFKP